MYSPTREVLQSGNQHSGESAGLGPGGARRVAGTGSDLEPRKQMEMKYEVGKKSK